jgi:hypothetical protein
MIGGWLDEFVGWDKNLGADPRGKQMADAARLDGAMGGWFKDFLDRWVEL